MAIYDIVKRKRNREREINSFPSSTNKTKWLTLDCKVTSFCREREKLYGLDNTGLKEKVAGKIKEVAGKVLGNKEMEAKGIVKKTVGKAQAKFGDVKADVKKATT